MSLSPYLLEMFLKLDLAFIRFPGIEHSYLAIIHLLYQNNRQVQLIQGIEYTGQGGLVSKLSLQSRDQHLIICCCLADRHAIHAIAPPFWDTSFDHDPAASQSPALFGLVGTEMRMSARLVMSSSENRMPVMATARGVVKRNWGNAFTWSVIRLLSLAGLIIIEMVRGDAPHHP
jgi:hypothetical protein